MWFAALGSMNQNPWFIHLLKKLLDNCDPVTSLLAGRTLEKNITKIRARLYSYDFTRLPFEWNREIPGASILSDSTFWPEKVWDRSFQGWYAPALEPNNPSLEQYVSAHQYPQSCFRNNMEKCESSSRWCHLTVLIRSSHLVWFAPGIAIVLLVTSKATTKKKATNEKKQQ